jgi:hypothetical protein
MQDAQTRRHGTSVASERPSAKLYLRMVVMRGGLLLQRLDALPRVHAATLRTRREPSDSSSIDAPPSPGCSPRRRPQVHSRIEHSRFIAVRHARGEMRPPLGRTVALER